MPEGSGIRRLRGHPGTTQLLTTVARMNAQITLKQRDLATSAITAQKNILVTLNRLDAMIENLLDGSRIRAGERLSLQFTNCDLAAVIREVVEELRMIHGPRIVAVSKEELNGNWGTDGLRRAVENLITNAVKFSTKETPITVSWETGMKTIDITVQNEGPVIPEEEIPRLSQKFREELHAPRHRRCRQGQGRIC